MSLPIVGAPGGEGHPIREARVASATRRQGVPAIRKVFGKEHRSGGRQAERAKRQRGRGGEGVSETHSELSEQRPAGGTHSERGGTPERGGETMSIL